MTTASAVTADRLAEQGLANNKGMKLDFVEVWRLHPTTDIIDYGKASKVFHADFNSANGQTADPVVVTAISGKNISLKGAAGLAKGYVVYK